MKELTKKNIAYDIMLTLALAALQFIGFIGIMIHSYGFMTCGNEHLELWTNIRNGFIAFLVIFIFQILITLHSYKLGTVIIRISFWVITLSSLVPIYLLGRDTLNYSEFYQEFDSEVWHASVEKPLTMIRVICDDQRFIGKSRLEVIEVLGEGFDSWTIDENEIGYYTNTYASPLVFTLENDLVVKYELHCYD